MSTDFPAREGPRATFNQRLLAFLIDWVLLNLVGVLVSRSVGFALSVIFSVGIGVAYYTYFEGSGSGQTVGKRALNIRVVDMETAAPLGTSRAFVRYVGRLISGLPLFLGYFWMLWDADGQTWHDMIVGTVVVPTSAYPVEAWPG